MTDKKIFTDDNNEEDIDDYLRGVIAANLSKRIPFNGNQ